ncbi:hypothetical protein DIPPA_70004 [Diplonema papillatum]|nr:hypothetical protein DIPPA_70004 [Diplonema papillatum]
MLTYMSQAALVAAAMLCLINAIIDPGCPIEFIEVDTPVSRRRASRRSTNMRGTKGIRNVTGQNCFASALVQILRLTDWQGTIEPGTRSKLRSALFSLIRHDGRD